MQGTYTESKVQDLKAHADPNPLKATAAQQLSHPVQSISSSARIEFNSHGVRVTETTTTKTEYPWKNQRDGSFGNLLAITGTSSPLANGTRQPLLEAPTPSPSSEEESLFRKALFRTGFLDSPLASMRRLRDIFGRKACLKSGQEARLTCYLRSEGLSESKSGSPCKSRQIPRREPTVEIFDAVVREREGIQQMGTCPKLTLMESSCAMSTSEPGRPVTEQLGASIEEIGSQFESHSFHGDGDGDSMSMKGATVDDDSRSELIPVPDVDGGSNCGGIDAENYWEWDFRAQRFTHWDEEDQEWVYCPDEFD